MSYRAYKAQEKPISLPLPLVPSNERIFNVETAGNTEKENKLLDYELAIDDLDEASIWVGACLKDSELLDENDRGYLSNVIEVIDRIVNKLYKKYEELKYSGEE